MQRTRIVQGVAGGAMLLLGLGGVVSAGSSPAAADPGGDGEGMRGMMAQMSQMMDDCSAMMDGMDDMSGMSDMERGTDEG